jgi:hypothetical protein
MDGNQVELVVEGGEERLTLTYGHHKNSSKTGKPIPSTYLPLGEPLTLALTWWIKVGHPKLRSGTMVSDDEVRAMPSTQLCWQSHAHVKPPRAHLCVCFVA